MITVKEASQKAIDYFNDLFKGTNYVSIALEELELSSDENFWLITIGYSEPGISAVLGSSMRRYKIFTIDVKSGELVSVKMRIV